MEKILKIIKKISLLIPILVFSLSIKNVFAEEPIKIYYNNISGNQYLFTGSFTNLSYDFTAFNTSFSVYTATTGRGYNQFVLKNTSTNDYFLIRIVCSNNYCTGVNGGDASINLTSSSVQIINNGQFTDLDTRYFRNYTALLSTTAKLNFFSNILDTEFVSTSSSIENYYLINQQSVGQSKINFFQYIADNSSDFELIYKDKDDLYINGIKKELYVEPEEPEEPEVPTLPSYNFDNNKYYVPNYQEGNCVEIIDKDTIRVFENEFSTNYIDYYINSHYISRQGNIELDYVKNCSNLQFTNIRYYGNDFPEILLITIIAIIFTIGFPYILYKRFRKR